MSGLELALRIVGASHLVLAIAHIPIARHLEWRYDIMQTTPLTQQVFWSHTFFICVVLTFMGALAVYDPQVLITPSILGLYVTGALTLFWGLRLIFQWFVFSSDHWRGQPHRLHPRRRRRRRLQRPARTRQ